MIQYKNSFLHPFFPLSLPFLFSSSNNHYEIDTENTEHRSCLQVAHERVCGFVCARACVSLCWGLTEEQASKQIITSSSSFKGVGLLKATMVSLSTTEDFKTKLRETVPEKI